MVIGDPCKFGFIIERIREWEASGTYQSGIVFLFLDNTIYPDTVRNTTLNVDLYHLTRDDNPFMNPVIDPASTRLPSHVILMWSTRKHVITAAAYTS